MRVLQPLPEVNHLLNLEREGKGVHHVTVTTNAHPTTTTTTGEIPLNVPPLKKHSLTGRGKQR